MSGMVTSSWLDDIKVVLKGLIKDPVNSQNLNIEPKRLLAIGFAMWIPFLLITHIILSGMMNASLEADHMREWGSVAADVMTKPTLGFGGHLKLLIISIVPLTATLISIKLCDIMLKAKTTMAKIVYNVGLIYLPSAIFLIILSLLGIEYVKTLIVAGIFTFCSTISLINAVFVHGMSQTERKTLVLTPITLIVAAVATQWLYGVLF